MGERTHQPEAASEVAHASNPLTDPIRLAVGAILDRTLGRGVDQHPAVPFVVDKDHLSFAAVVGRPSVALGVTVTNRDSARRPIDARLEGAASEFHLESTFEVLHPASEEDGRGSVEIPVRYTPTVAGVHDATLVLTSDGYETRVALRGAASELSHDAVRGHDAAEPLLPLPAPKEPSTAGEQQGQLDAALDSLSRAAEQFNAAAPPNDATRDKASHRMLAAIQGLQKRVLRWLQSEGMHAMATSHQPGTGAEGVIKAFLMKGLEHGLEHFLELGGPPLAAVMFAIELGDVARETVAERGEHAEAIARYAETMNTAFSLGCGAQDAATSAILHRYGGVLAAYAGARAEVREIAGPQAMAAIADIQHVRHAVGADTAYFYDKAREVVSRFHAAMLDWGAATGQLEVTAGRIETIASKGYDELLNQYAQFRMERAREQALPMKEVAGIPLAGLPDVEEAFETVRVEGGISFADPVNIQFNRFRFGGYADMSDEMRRALGQTVISESKRPVEVHLIAAEGGEVVLRKHGSHKSVRTHGNAAAYVRTIGEDRLWAALENATLGPKVIKVP
jgi:hypothetical protein